MNNRPEEITYLNQELLYEREGKNPEFDMQIRELSRCM
jgi:hypothetical protein